LASGLTASPARAGEAVNPEAKEIIARTPAAE